MKHIEKVIEREQAWQNCAELPSVENQRKLAETGEGNAPREALDNCVDALMAVRQAYQDLFEVMPVAWQTYDHIVCEAIEQSGREQSVRERTKAGNRA